MPITESFNIESLKVVHNGKSWTSFPNCDEYIADIDISTMNVQSLYMILLRIQSMINWNI